MASPQKENGFTPIANEIIEKLVNTALLGAEFQVALFILRKTYGYHKKKDRISLTQFEKATGLSRPTVVKTLKNLVIRNMIVKIILPNDNVEYTFQKDHDKWVVNTALLVKHNDTASKARLTKTSKARLTHKRKKDNTKDNSKAVALRDNPSSLEKRLEGKQINELLEAFKDVNPMYSELFKNTTERNAIEFMALKFGYEKILNALNSLGDIVKKPFAPKITKPTEFKRDFAKLVLFVKQENNQETKYGGKKIY